MNNNFHNIPAIMGILNITPDSFHSPSRFLDIKSLKGRLDSIFESDIIDIGAESSRPGSTPLTVSEELERLNMVFENRHIFKDKLLSIDTYKPEVAKKALKNKFNIINDIYGGRNEKNLMLASEFEANIVLMHIKGNPATMQNDTFYKNIIGDIMNYFDKRISKAISFGVKESNIIIDPGVGFGKSQSDNYKIINNIKKFKSLGFKVMLGLSRKSFLSVNGDSSLDRLNATICANTVAILNGVDIIRVHDIKEHIVIRKIINNLIQSN